MLNVMLAAAPAIDTGLVTQLIDLVKSTMGLFSVYPLNICIIAGLATIAFALITAARGATGV